MEQEMIECPKCHNMELMHHKGSEWTCLHCNSLVDMSCDPPRIWENLGVTMTRPHFIDGKGTMND